jgi:2-aminoethylphosphonate dioxygenase
VGYPVLRTSEHKLVSPRDLQAWTGEVRDWPREKDKWMPYDEINAKGERQLMRTENFVDYHDRFRGLLYGEPIGEILKQLSGDVSTLIGFYAVMKWDFAVSFLFRSRAWHGNI